MPWYKLIPPGLWIVLGTLALVGVTYLFQGERIFSPGRLHNAPRGKVALGGVRSHAELEGRCNACHVPPGSDTRMESLCMNCHTDVAQQIQRRAALHGNFSDPENCRTCHTEHRGEVASLTDWTHFDHKQTSFPLTGKHLSASCASCHQEKAYRAAPRSCVACHAEPKVHLGRFGTSCASCHTTASWKNAKTTAEFHRFPLRHGGGKNRGSCVTCHQNPENYQVYTCYGCHKHDPEKTAEKHRKLKVDNLQNCATCHPTGRKRERGKEKDRLSALLETDSSSDPIELLKYDPSKYEPIKADSTRIAHAPLDVAHAPLDLERESEQPFPHDQTSKFECPFIFSKE